MLRLYRASPSEVLARAGERLGELRWPALIEWPTRDPYIDAEFGQRLADALGGETELEHVEAGHYAWLERPELIERVAALRRLAFAPPCSAPPSRRLRAPLPQSPPVAGGASRAIGRPRRALVHADRLVARRAGRDRRRCSRSST